MIEIIKNVGLAFIAVMAILFVFEALFFLVACIVSFYSDDEEDYD